MKTPNNYEAPARFAKRIDVPVARVLRWIRERKVPFVRIGRTVLIPTDALDRLRVDHEAARPDDVEDRA